MIGIDISKESLKKAKIKFPSMIDHHSSAEKLNMIDNGCVDLYISLRTFQSTFFNMKEAIHEAYRVLRSGGTCIISISNAHRVNETIIQGILKGNNNEVDFDYPYELSENIRKELRKLDFSNIGIYTGKYEIYICGNKTF